MKKLIYSVALAALVFTASSFTTVNHPKALVIKNKKFDIHGGFTYNGTFYAVTVNSTNKIITNVTAQNAPFTVTSAGGFLGTSGNIHVTVNLSNGTSFVYEGPF